MSTGQAIVKSLRGHGVDTVFALPGVQLDYLFNAFHDEGNSLRIVHPRHEQAAGYMALGYAQATGRVGVFACPVLILVPKSTCSFGCWSFVHLL